MILPPWAYIAGGALALGGSFVAGWQVRAWKCDAAQLKVVKLGVKEAKEQQATVHVEAREHAQEAQDADQATRTRETEIRTIYRNVAVPGGCEPPPAALRVLDSAVEAANARAGGKPGPVMPSRTTTTHTLGRP